MQRRAINTYSIQKIAQMNAEAPVRVELAKRAGGIPVSRIVTICRKGEIHHVTKVKCIGGICEKCHKPQVELEPHEKIFRSHMGVLSLENTIMVCRSCHRTAQKNEPQLNWIKSEAQNESQ